MLCPWLDCKFVAGNYGVPKESGLRSRAITGCQTADIGTTYPDLGPLACVSTAARHAVKVRQGLGCDASAVSQPTIRIFFSSQLYRDAA
ncbi:MAG: hypothetical protein AAGD07_04970 [Planctomycetota bacterium]